MLRLRTVVAAAVGLVMAAALLVAPVPAANAAIPTGTLRLAAGQKITATFTGTKLSSKRLVVLQASDDGMVWQTLQTVKMSSKGSAAFGVIATDHRSYRAVARTFTYKVKKKKVTIAQVVTPVVTLGAATFAEEFNSDTLDPAVWRHRTVIGYNGFERWCAAPVEANTVVSGGSARLMTTAVTDAEKRAGIIEGARAQLQKLYQGQLDAARVTEAAAKTKLDAAKKLPAKTKSQKKKRTSAIKKATSVHKSAVAARRAVETKMTPCPFGTYDNAMISTEGKRKFSAGTLVARVKFAQGQGSHAGLWLQAATGEEIDIIEAYGHGRGITNVVHRKVGDVLRKEPAAAMDAYVAVKTVRSASWWSKWHTVAVTFDGQSISFWMDGVRTRRVAGIQADFSLIVSQLSSDWETYRVKKPDVRPGSGVKRSTVKKKALPITFQIDWIRVWEKAT